MTLTRERIEALRWRLTDEMWSNETAERADRNALCDLALRALASLSTATEGNGWRPIESAPKGETLLVTDGKRVWADFKGAEHGWIFRHGDDAPTHWRPLPTPPEAA